MRKNAFILPAFALLAGVLGLFLRKSELRTVFDEVTGLAEPGARVTMLLIGLSCAVVLVSLVFSIIAGVRYRSPEGFENAFGPLGVTYVLLFFALGLAWLLTAAYSLFSAATEQVVVIADIYLLALSALSALSVMLLAISLYKQPGKSAKLFFSVLPPLFLCLWLVMLYRENSANPVLLKFCYESLAIITSAMAFYYTAGFVYGRPAPGKASFSYLTASFFCIITLADNILLRQKVVFAAMLVMHLVHASLMIGRLTRKKIDRPEEN